MKNHLKRIATPRTWPIKRKQSIFVVRPNPGAHSFEDGISLGMVLRDLLKIAFAMSEVKKILNNKNILVDGKRRKDHRFIIGLFDVLSFPDLEKYYRVLLDGKGRIAMKEISVSESKIKVCKVVGKKVLTKNKNQFNFHDGKNVLSDEKAKVGDTIILNLPDLKIKEVLPLEIGSYVFLTKGKHSGQVGKLKLLKNEEAIYTTKSLDEGSKEVDVETAKKYLFVIGKKEPVIKVGVKRD